MGWEPASFASLIVAGNADQWIAYGRTAPHEPARPLRAPWLAWVLRRWPTATRIAYNRLGPGCVLAEHAEPHIGGLRLHLPIRTNPKAVLWVDGRPSHLPAGRLWPLPIGRPHAAANYGTTARVHLTVDVPAP